MLLLVAVPLVLLASATAFVFLRTERGLRRARTVVEQRRHMRFELLPLNGLQTRTEGAPFEPVASAVSFAAGTFFRGSLYLSGPAGLYVYGAGGAALDGRDSEVFARSATLLHTYQVGLDLPAAPLGPMVVGTLRGAGEPELMIATAGEGVLLFTPPSTAGGSGSFRQLRPELGELRDVTALLPLASGDLLIGTRRAGLQLFSGSTLSAFRADLVGVPITALAADSHGGFWAGTRDRGALHWNAGTMERVDVAAGLPDEQVESLLVQGADVFVGTPVGVAQLRQGRVVRRLAEGSFAHTLALSEAGRALAVGTLEEGVLDLPLQAGAARRAIPRPAEATAGPVAALISARDAVYAVLRDSVGRRAAGGWETVVERAPAALADGNISALAFAPDGRLWVGYFDHGVDVLGTGLLSSEAARASRPAAERAEHLEDDAVFCVNRLMVDPQRKTMVAATANGLVLFDAQGRERQVLTRRDGLIADHVTDVAATRRGLALATPAGLTFVDADGTQSLYGFEGLVNNHVYALGVQPDGDEMLAGTLGGVSLLASEAVRRNLTVANSTLRHNWVTAIVPTAGGGWMVGTYGAGVMSLDKDGHFAAMEGATREMVINPNAMLATAEHVFAGSLGQGLWAYTRSAGRWRQMTKGLPSQNVTAMVERGGEIYVGTENGLVRFAEQAIDSGGTR